MAVYYAAARHAQPSGLRHGAPKHAAKPKKIKHAGQAPEKTPKKPKSKGKKALKIIIVLVIIAAIGATVGVVGYNVYRDQKKAQPFRFSKNVAVAGIDISELSEKAAREKLEKNSMDVVKDFKLNVEANGTEKTFTKDDFKFTFDYDTPIESAKVYSLKEQGIYDEPEATTETSYTEPETSAEGVAEFDLEYKIDEKSISESVLGLARDVNSKAVDAKVSKFHPFSDKRFEFKEGKDGYRLKRADLEKKLLSAFNSGESEADIKAEVKTLKPELTVKKLKKNIVGLSHATSTSYNTTDGTNNMALALSACNGSVINPGKIWSFNKCTGDSNLESNGYRASTVIVEGRYEQGIGGGICQASTVIYQAAVLGNVDIYERHCHYFTSSYALSGEDATIDYPNLDLKLRNLTDYPLFLECKVEGTTLIANIYGYQDPSYDNVKMYTENYDIGSSSYKTKTYRVLYLKGKEVKSEIVNYSTYSLDDGHYVKEADTSGTYRTLPDGTTYSEEPEETEPEPEEEEPEEEEPEYAEPEPEQTEAPTDEVTEEPTDAESEEPAEEAPTEDDEIAHD